MAKPPTRKPKAGEEIDEEVFESDILGEDILQTFFFFGRYSAESLREASPDRTEKSDRLIKAHGGHVGAMYALLGEFDLVMITQFRSVEDAIRASVALTRETGISWITSPAIPVEYFDKLIEEG